MADRRLYLAAVGVLGLLALLHEALADRRPPPPELRAATQFRVTSARDHGPGSLREAILAADRAAGRARIILATPRIELQTPLPPLVNPAGVVIDVAGPACEIDATGLASGPVLDVAAPDSVVRGLKIRNASGQGILVRSDRCRLFDLSLVRCREAIVASGSVRELTVRGSTFIDNGTGVRLAPEEGRTVLLANQFSGSRRAAVWAVIAEPVAAGRTTLELRDNSFEGNRIGVFLGNVSALVEDNRVSEQVDTGIHVLGGRAAIRNNRVRAGRGVGILLDGTGGTQIVANEIDGHGLVGILMRSAANCVASDNRIYRNGYGIADVFGDPARPNLVANNLVFSQRVDGLYVLAGSPLLHENQLLGNGAAGARILDYVTASGLRRPAQPLLRDNRQKDNAFDQPIRAEQRETTEGAK